jgi:hypothetical protein
MHGPETAEVHRGWKPELLDDRLQVAARQVVPIERTAASISEDQIFRSVLLRPRPGPVENAPQDFEGI